MQSTSYNTYNPYKAKRIQYIIVRNEYKANNIGGLTNNIGGLTTCAGIAEPHSPPPEEQADPGSIPDKAPFFSIVDFQCFAVTLSKVCA